MSDVPNEAASRSAGQSPTEFPPNVMAERMRKVRELTDATLVGARATAESTAMMAAEEANTTAETAAEASQEMADALGLVLARALRGAARCAGALVGGAKGAAGGLILAAQIGGSAAGEAARSAAGSTARAAGHLGQGVALGFEDQEQGTQEINQATRTLAQELFDAGTGAALGGLGGAATAAGAVAGGAKGALSGSTAGLKELADAGAEATWIVGREAAKGGTEAMRRALRRQSDE